MAISIGKPIYNVQAYILDVSLNLLPIGVPGELYVGGAGLARGYRRRSKLTAEKFIANPFSVGAGKASQRESRLYKTGDLARYLPDGSIELLGRIDTQVKIRGFRIELGEIEAVLIQHAGVRDALVRVQESTDADQKRLVAYLVTEKTRLNGSDLHRDLYGDLRRFLKEKLPDHMIPAVFVTLEALPLMPSGKVDEQALPVPAPSQNRLSCEFIAPRNDIEAALSQIWCHLLDQPQVGIHDNFFELGGHSLLATQIVSRIRTEFFVELPLKALFETPTVCGLAETIETLRWVQTTDGSALEQMKGEREVIEF